MTTIRTGAVTGSRERGLAEAAPWIAAIAAVLGALMAVLQLALPTAVPAAQFSAPVTPAVFTIDAIVLALHHLAIVPLIVLVARMAASGPLGRIGGTIASVALVGLAVAELVSITAAHEQGVTAVTGAVEAGYGATTMLLGLGEVLLGVAVIRAGRWHGWARPLPLITGVYIFVPMTPTLLVGDPLTTIALAVWSLLYLPLAVAALRQLRAGR